jgi:hypothetical protein
MKALTLLLMICLITGSCNKDDDAQPCDIEIKPGTRFFEFQASEGTKFVAWTNKQSVLDNIDAQLAREVGERDQHINGKILKNDTGCDLNYEWSWYFDPDDWDLSDISIELCDGNPNYVEENLNDYLDIERYCPWSSVVLREIDQPF